MKDGLVPVLYRIMDVTAGKERNDASKQYFTLMVNFYFCMRWRILVVFSLLSDSVFRRIQLPNRKSIRLDHATIIAWLISFTWHLTTPHWWATWLPCFGIIRSIKSVGANIE